MIVSVCMVCGRADREVRVGDELSHGYCGRCGPWVLLHEDLATREEAQEYQDAPATAGVSA